MKKKRNHKKNEKKTKRKKRKRGKRKKEKTNPDLEMGRKILIPFHEKIDFLDHRFGPSMLGLLLLFLFFSLKFLLSLNESEKRGKRKERKK